jgi:hypothetical protein
MRPSIYLGKKHQDHRALSPPCEVNNFICSLINCTVSVLSRIGRTTYHIIALTPSLLRSDGYYIIFAHKGVSTTISVNSFYRRKKIPCQTNYLSAFIKIIPKLPVSITAVVIFFKIRWLYFHNCMETWWVTVNCLLSCHITVNPVLNLSWILTEQDRGKSCMPINIKERDRQFKIYYIILFSSCKMYMDYFFVQLIYFSEMFSFKVFFTSHI